MQARNFTTNVSKILDLKSSSEQIFFRKLSLGAPDLWEQFIPSASLKTGGGTSDFKWQKSKQKKKALGLPTIPKKLPGPKTNRQKMPCRILKALNDIIGCTLFGGTLFANYAAGIRGHCQESSG